jgi:hypothetical protein
MNGTKVKIKISGTVGPQQQTALRYELQNKILNYKERRNHNN